MRREGDDEELLGLSRLTVRVLAEVSRFGTLAYDKQNRSWRDCLNLSEGKKFIIGPRLVKE